MLSSYQTTQLFSKSAGCGLLIMALNWACSASADTPLGWINTSNPAAYTTTKGELEISAGGIAVNDTIDIFNYRDDLIAASGRLVGDSGYLTGTRLQLNYGVTPDISVFYKRQQHALELDLGAIAAINLLDIDTSLNTLAQSAGFKWTFYRANILNPDNRQSAASLEVSASRNESDDFDVVLNEIRLNNLNIYFRDPQTFSIANMADEGWAARLIYSMPIGEVATGTLWAGYGESSSESGTTSDLASATFAKLFAQDFSREESYFHLGASLTYNVTARLPVTLNYQYLTITDSHLRQYPETPSTALPSFLSGTNQGSASNNHSLEARVSYWITPHAVVSATGNLYSNQFVGVLPHYNNPLSGSFASVPYGFAGIELGYKF